MPHANASLQLKTYGKTALDLDKLIKSLLAPKKGYNRQEYAALHRKLVDYSNEHDLLPLIPRLALDTYAYNRELAGFTLFYLWQAWKFSLPYATEIDKENYGLNKNTYSKNLEWSLPLIHELLHDRNIRPIESALYAVRELSEINEQNAKNFQKEVEKLCTHRSTNIRLLAVRILPDTYPSNQDARRILSRSAIETLVQRTYDKVEKVRDWSCFELGQSVENINAKVEQAFHDAYLREDQDSEVYVEAVVGLARCGIQEVIPIINEQLQHDGVGTGWIDAAEKSHSSECLIALLDAYEKFLRANPDDKRLSDFERVIIDWNEY